MNIHCRILMTVSDQHHCPSAVNSIHYLISHVRSQLFIVIAFHTFSFKSDSSAFHVGISWGGVRHNNSKATATLKGHRYILFYEYGKKIKMEREWEREREGKFILLERSMLSTTTGGRHHAYGWATEANERPKLHNITIISMTNAMFLITFILIWAERLSFMTSTFVQY